MTNKEWIEKVTPAVEAVLPTGVGIVYAMDSDPRRPEIISFYIAPVDEGMDTKYKSVFSFDVRELETGTFGDAKVKKRVTEGCLALCGVLASRWNWRRA